MGRGRERQREVPHTNTRDLTYQSDPVIIGLVEASPCGYKLSNIRQHRVGSLRLHGVHG